MAEESLAAVVLMGVAVAAAIGEAPFNAITSTPAVAGGGAGTGWGGVCCVL